MRYVAAALLVNMAGNELTRANIQRILESVGVECEDDKLQIVLDQLKGKVTCHSFKIYFESVLRIRYPGLLTPGPVSGIRNRFFLDLGSQTRNLES
jgi:hypothetical protein